jgi:hypothetical protein
MTSWFEKKNKKSSNPPDRELELEQYHIIQPYPISRQLEVLESIR